jgi:NitT/TauT family transport system substrate-binding protein
VLKAGHRDQSADFSERGAKMAIAKFKLARRAMGFVLILVAFFLASLPCSSRAADKVRIGFAAISIANGPVWIAEERNIFKKYEIEPEVIVVGGGATRAVSALIAGDLQFAASGGGSAISAALSGADAVMVASGNNKGVQRLVVRPDIKTPDAVKGKRIGITSYGSSGHVALLLILRKWGMSADEVQIVPVGASPVMLISLQKGGIDAAILQDPTFFVAEDMGYKTLADPAAMDIHYLQNMLISTRAFLRAHRDAAGRFVKAYVEGIAYFKKNKEDSLKILMKKMRIEPGKESFLEKSYQIYASQYFDNVPYPSLTGTKTVLEFLAKDYPKAKAADPASFIDSSLVKELDTGGFIKSLYP